MLELLGVDITEYIEQRMPAESLDQDTMHSIAGLPSDKQTMFTEYGRFLAATLSVSLEMYAHTGLPGVVVVDQQTLPFVAHYVLTVMIHDAPPRLNEATRADIDQLIDAYQPDESAIIIAIGHTEEQAVLVLPGLQLTSPGRHPRAPDIVPPPLSPHQEHTIAITRRFLAMTEPAEMLAFAQNLSDDDALLLELGLQRTIPMVNAASASTIRQRIAVLQASRYGSNTAMIDCLKRYFMAPTKANARELLWEFADVLLTPQAEDLVDRFVGDHPAATIEIDQRRQLWHEVMQQVTAHRQAHPPTLKKPHRTLPRNDL